MRCFSAFGWHGAAASNTSASTPIWLTYGKTVAGGLPIGVVCGRGDLIETLSRGPAGGCLLCPRDLQRPPVCHGSDGGVPGPVGDARDPELLPRPGNGLGQPGSAVERALARGRSTRASGESVFCVDGVLPAALSLSLDVSVLPARGEPGTELGGHRPAYLQLGLHRRGICRGRRSLRSGSTANATGRVVVGRRCAHAKSNQASCAARNDSGSCISFIGSISCPRSR